MCVERYKIHKRVYCFQCTQERVWIYFIFFLFHYTYPRNVCAVCCKFKWTLIEVNQHGRSHCMTFKWQYTNPTCHANPHCLFFAIGKIKLSPINLCFFSLCLFQIYSLFRSFVIFLLFILRRSILNKFYRFKWIALIKLKTVTFLIVFSWFLSFPTIALTLKCCIF